MANYAEKADVEALTGQTYSDDPKTRPSATGLLKLLTLADKKINNEIGTKTNVTDTYGILKVIECSLVRRMIHNIYHFSHPDEYDMLEENLTEDERREIHKEHWTCKSWEVGS